MIYTHKFVCKHIIIHDLLNLVCLIVKSLFLDLTFLFLFLFLYKIEILF